MKKLAMLALLLCFMLVPAVAEPPHRYAASVGGKIGFLDETGRMVIPPQFKFTYGFTEGLAAVQVGDKFGYIDTSGKLVIPPRFYHAYAFSDGLAAFHSGKGMGYIDHQGKVVIQPIYAEVTRFKEGLTMFRPNDGSKFPPYGYLDKQGKVVLPARYKSALDFSEGLAWVVDDSGTRYINRAGETVIDVRKRRLDSLGRSFREGLCSVITWDKHLTGFMDKTGQVRIPGIFEDTPGFFHGLAPVKLKGKWGFIDKTGQMVIPATFQYASPFGEDGLAEVSVTDHECGYIDRRGKWAISPHFYSAAGFDQGRALVMDAALNTMFIDTKGKVLWRGKLVIPVK